MMSPERDSAKKSAMCRPNTNISRISQMTSSFSVIALVAANLAPLFGVLFLGWNAPMILLLYWSENVIIGAYNVLKMALVRMDPPISNLGKVFVIPFFCIHFGGFCAVHGMFLMAFFKGLGDGGNLMRHLSWPGPLVFIQLLVSVIATLWATLPAAMAWPIAGLAVSHGISFVENYLAGGEYRKTSLSELMSQPYGRVVILHVTILAGGFCVAMFGSPVPMVAALVFLKTGLDVYLHRRSHASRVIPAWSGDTLLDE